MDTLACLVELSNAVLPLICKAGSGAEQKMGAVRIGGSTAEAGDHCARFYQQVIEYAKARNLMYTGPSDDCGASMLNHGDRAPQSAVGLVLNRLARAAAIVLKPEGFTAFEQSSLNWPVVWHQALDFTAIALESASVSGKRLCQARLDAASLTDILTRVLLNGKTTRLPEFQRILSCVSITIPENSFLNRSPASLLSLIKKVLEAHLALISLVPDPQQWASRCSENWDSVLDSGLKLPAATMAKINALKRQLAALVPKGAAAHEKAALALLEEEAAEARKQAKKAKKKSKQQARKQKAQAAKNCEPSAAPSKSLLKGNPGDEESGTSGCSEPAEISERERERGDLETSSADIPEADGSRDQLNTPVNPSADLDRDLRDASGDMRRTEKARQNVSTKGAQKTRAEPRPLSLGRAESPSDPRRETTVAEIRSPGHTESPPPGLVASKANEHSSTVVCGSVSAGRVLTAALHRPRPKSNSGKRPVCLPEPLSGRRLQAVPDRKLELPAAEIPFSSSPSGRAAEATEYGERDLIDQFEDLCTCPITHEYFLDPVTAADGFTYERSKIEEWLRKAATSLMTGAPLPSLQLRPNLSVRQMLGTVRGQQRWQGAVIDGV